jgi:DNA-binding LacI/PurR family transcriptional regulator
MSDTARKYDVIAEALKNDILAKRYHGRLPGIHTLADTYGVNFKTVNRAVTRLVAAGLVRTVTGEGRVIVAAAQAHAARTVLTLTRTEGHTCSEVTLALVRGLQAAGYSALPVDAAHFGGTEDETRRLLAHAPMGLVFDDSISVASAFYEQHKAAFARRVAWASTPGKHYPDAMTVASDGRQGMYLATRHLLAQGRRRILFMLHPWKWGAATHRHSSHALMMEGYETALAEAGLAQRKRYLITADDDHETLQQLATIFRASPARRPDAVVSFADYLAAGAIRELLSLGLQVPRDVAVVGYFNTPWTQLCEVPLSSVSIREPELARAIVDSVTGAYEPGRVVTVEPELVVRASSQPGT